MALRSSSSGSLASLKSKVKSYASSAQSYSDSKYADDYANGYITGNDYLTYLQKRADATSPTTTSYVSLSKKIRSVKGDIAQNEIQTKVDLGLKDPIELADLITRRVADEGIIEGTPEYNSILKSVVSLRDKSVNYEKDKKYQEYKEMRLKNPSQAEKMWDDYLQTLPNRYNNQLNVESAVNEAENFHNTRIKNELTRALNQTVNELRANGITGAGYYATMRTAYRQAAEIAQQNGLLDFASTLEDRAANADSYYGTAAEAEIKSATKDQKELATARVQDLKNEITQMEKNFDGNLPALREKYGELIGALNLEKEISGNLEDYSNVATVEGQLQTYTDKASKYDNVWKVDGTGKVIPMLDEATGEYVMPEVNSSDYVLTRNSDGTVELKQISKLNTDGSIEFQGQGNYDAKTGVRSDFVVDPNTGMFLHVDTEDIKQRDPMTGQDVISGQNYFVQTPGSSERKYIAKDEMGNNIIIGQDLGNGIYKEQKEDGGYDYFKYDGKKLESIDKYDASELSGKTIADIVSGSKKPEDQKLAKNFGTYKYSKEIEPLLNRYSVGKKAEAYYSEVRAAEDAKRKQQLAAEESLTKLNQQNSSVQAAQQITKITPETPTFIKPTSLISAKKTPAPTQEQLINDKGINFQALATKQTIAPGYYRQRKTDGGFDYFKEGFGSISVEDLAKETKTNVNMLKDPNATSFGLI